VQPLLLSSALSLPALPMCTYPRALPPTHPCHTCSPFSAQAVMLRRTKQSQIDGRPIVDLPPRHQELLKTRECFTFVRCLLIMLQAGCV